MTREALQYNKPIKKFVNFFATVTMYKLIAAIKGTSECFTTRYICDIVT